MWGGGRALPLHPPTTKHLPRRGDPSHPSPRASTFIRGDLTVDNSEIQGDVATSGTEADGGGVANFSTATIVNTIVNRNGADGGSHSAQGGGIWNSGGFLTLKNSQLNANSARTTTGVAQGGGLWNGGGGTATLKGDQVLHNFAGFTTAPGTAAGGGIFNAGGTVTVRGSSVKHNKPDNCAGGVSGC